MFNYITPEEYLKIKDITDKRTLKQLKKAAASNPICEVCGQPAWKLGGTGLCFSCTTGEADNTDDYELKVV
jgi:hypothetical protein